MAKVALADGTEVAVPQTPDELAEIMADDEKREAIFADPESRDGFLAAWKQMSDKNGNLSKQIEDSVAATMQAQLAEWTQNEDLKRPDFSDMAKNVANEVAHKIKPGADNASIYNPRALGASLDDEFPDIAAYMQAIWHSADQTPERSAQLTRLRAAHGETVPSEGGFLVPERLRSEILRVSLESSIVRSRARVIPMDSLRVPFPAIDSTSNASSVYGGIVAYWTAEAASLTEVEAGFGQATLEAKKLTAFTLVNNELVADSVVSFNAFMNTIFPEAVSFYEDYAFLRGNGTGEPLGVLNAPGLISVTKESGQPADTIVLENLVNMYSRMLPGSQSRAVWLASHDTFPQLATMALNVGTGGSAVWLTNAVNTPPMSIFGRPVIFTEKVPTVGDANDISFVDFGFYLLGDRQAMSARSSTEFKFQTDQTAYRIIERVDGLPWVNSAFTPKNSGSTVSPYVGLAERA